MNFSVVSPDRTGNVDPTIRRNLLDYFPQGSPADVRIVPISYLSNFAFDEHVLPKSKPYILVDFLEYFGQQGPDTHLFGVSEQTSTYQVEEWRKFDQWVRDHPPLLYFKRELLRKDRSEKVVPVEFPCYLDSWAIEDEAAFNARPLDVFYCWGFSNCARPALHGEIFKQMCPAGLNVISDFAHIDHHLRLARPRSWVTIFTPHFARVKMSEVVLRQAQSKISVSLPGSGVKCFRSTEAPINTVPAMLYDDMAWGIPWVHCENCIRLDPANPFDNLFKAATYADLHGIYVNAQATVDLYRGQNYVDKYMIPLIERALAS